MIIKPIMTEKRVKLIELENTIVFLVERKHNKKEIKEYLEKFFDVKIDRIRTLIKDNRKIVYVKLIKSNLASNLATKLGIL